jgi:hypothetical protein
VLVRGSVRVSVCEHQSIGLKETPSVGRESECRNISHRTSACWSIVLWSVQESVCECQSLSLRELPSVGLPGHQKVIL